MILCPYKRADSDNYLFASLRLAGMAPDFHDAAFFFSFGPPHSFPCPPCVPLLRYDHRAGLCDVHTSGKGVGPSPPGRRKEASYRL